MSETGSLFNSPFSRLFDRKDLFILFDFLVITITPVPLLDHYEVKKFLKPRCAIITLFTII